MRSSTKRRALWMAFTAWSASDPRTLTSSAVYACASRRPIDRAPSTRSPSRSGTIATDTVPSARIRSVFFVLGSPRTSATVTGRFVARAAPTRPSPTRKRRIPSTEDAVPAAAARETCAPSSSTSQRRATLESNSSTAAPARRWKISSSESVAVSVCASRVSVSSRRLFSRASLTSAARATARPTWWATACRRVSSPGAHGRGAREISASTPQVRPFTAIGNASCVWWPPARACARTSGGSICECVRSVTTWRPVRTASPTWLDASGRTRIRAASAGARPRWARSVRVCAVESTRKTPATSIRAMRQTTSSVRWAVSARFSPLPIACATAESASSCRRRPSSLAGPSPRGRLPRRARAEASTPPATASSETAHQYQKRRSAAVRPSSGTSAHTPLAASSGRTSHVSPSSAVAPARVAAAQPAPGSPGRVDASARSPPTTTTAAREGRRPRAGSRDSSRRPTTTVPTGSGASPRT